MKIFDLKKATIKDIDILVEERVMLLKTANKLQKTSDIRKMEAYLFQYYKWAIPSQNHIAYMAFKDAICVGTGGICFYQVLPTYHNPTGRKAYITNMYTKPEYRKQGIASYILDCLVKDSLKIGVKFISLEATEIGRSIYKKYGFADLYTEMQLKNETYDLNINKRNN